MVKVLLTGSDLAPSSKVAFGRLQELNSARGTYNAAPITEAPPVDTVVLTNRQPEKAKAPSGLLHETAKFLPAAGMLLAGSLLGGLVGGFGLQGAAIGALSTAGLMGAVHLLRAKKADANVVEPVSEIRNPFSLVDLSPEARETSDDTDSISPRTLAKARLQDDLVADLSDVHAKEALGAFPVDEAVETSVPRSGQIEHKGKLYDVRNIASGMLPDSYKVFSDEHPALKFRALRQAAKPAELQAPFTVLNNAPESMAVVTLGRNNAVVQTFDPTENTANSFKKSLESVMWE